MVCREPGIWKFGTTMRVGGSCKFTGVPIYVNVIFTLKSDVLMTYGYFIRPF